MSTPQNEKKEVKQPVNIGLLIALGIIVVIGIGYFLSQKQAASDPAITAAPKIPVNSANPPRRASADKMRKMGEQNGESEEQIQKDVAKASENQSGN